MMNRWTILAALIALGGCDLGPGRTDTPQRPSLSRLATSNERVSRLNMEIRERDLRIKELEEHAERLAEKLRQAEFLNEQLRKQLAAVGDAPSERDRYKELSAQQSLEIRRLERAIEELRRQLGATDAPATQPAP
jgi:predicted RNase H-like nuclease (RuvC/YqgF family)